MGVAAAHPTAFVTSAEVLQELLHRYQSARRWSAGRGPFHSFARAMEDHIEPVYSSDVVRAAQLADRYTDLQARDLLHLAVMQRLGITRIASADGGFDAVESIERLDPAQHLHWLPADPGLTASAL